MVLSFFGIYIVMSFFSLIGVSGKIFSCVFIAVEDMEVVAIDLNVATYWHVCWRDEFH